MKDRQYRSFRYFDEGSNKWKTGTVNSSTGEVLLPKKRYTTPTASREVSRFNVPSGVGSLLVSLLLIFAIIGSFFAVESQNVYFSPSAFIDALQDYSSTASTSFLQPYEDFLSDLDDFDPTSALGWLEFIWNLVTLPSIAVVWFLPAIDLLQFLNPSNFFRSTSSYTEVYQW